MSKIKRFIEDHKTAVLVSATAVVTAAIVTPIAGAFGGKAMYKLMDREVPKFTLAPESLEHLAWLILDHQK